MALTGWVDSTEYVWRNAAVGALPFIVSIWANCAQTSDFRVLFALGQTGSGFDMQRLDLSDANIVRGVSIDASDADAADSAATHPSSTWFHAAAAFVANDSRAVYLNGTKATNLSTRTPAAPNATYIGTSPLPHFHFPTTGGLAEVSIWDATGMSEANRDSLVTLLAAGDNPINIDAQAAQPWTGKGVAYVLDSANSLTDLFGNGHNFTMVGTLTNFGSHPTIDPVDTGGITPVVGAVSLTGIASRMNLGMTPRSMVKIA